MLIETPFMIPDMATARALASPGTRFGTPQHIGESAIRVNDEQRQPSLDADERPSASEGVPKRVSVFGGEPNGET